MAHIVRISSWLGAVFIALGCASAKPAVSANPDDPTQIGLADFFTASAVELEAEVSQLEAKQTNGAALTADAECKLVRFADEAATKHRLSDALRVIAKARLATAEMVSKDLIAQHPDKPAGYQSLSRVHQRRGEWREYDVQIKEAERLLGDAPSFSVQYQRDVEAWKRSADETEARALLEKLREALPDYVRVQAALVFLQPDINTRYAEVQKLKAMNPGHLPVVLAEPSIREAYRTASSIRQAMAPATAAGDDSADAAPATEGATS